MSNLFLAGFGTLVTMLALAGFSVWQLDKTDAQAKGPGATPDAPANGSAPNPVASDDASRVA